MPRKDYNPEEEGQVEGEQEEAQEEEVLGPSGEFARRIPYMATSFALHMLFIVISLFWYIGITSSGEENIIVTLPREVPPEIKEKEKDIQLKDVELEQKVEDPLLTEKVEEKNESPADEPYESVMGENMENISDKPFKGKWANDVIGAGGGAGGAYGGPYGGLKHLRRGGGGARGDVKDAVLNALRWLARHQNSDGSWDVKGHTKNCGKHPKFPGQCNPNPGTDTFKVGVTGLSVLAFTGAGFTHMDKSVDKETGIVFGETVKKAVQYLVKVQDQEGCVGGREGEYMYNHLISTFALCEDYGLTVSPFLKEPTQNAVKFSIFAQNEGAGVRYEARSGESDSSVSGWLAQVYKSAEMAGFEVPQQNKDWIINWYDSVTDPSYYWVGYQARENLPVALRGVNDHYKHYPALTAISLMTRIFFKLNKDKYATGHANWIMKRDENKPTWSDDTDADFYYWYYTSYAMFQMGDSYWKWWEKPIEKVMLEKQNKGSDCKKGSWEPVDKWSYAGGRVYTTATGALILEVYYRFPNVFIEKKK